MLSDVLSLLFAGASYSCGQRVQNSPDSLTWPLAPWKISRDPTWRGMRCWDQRHQHQLFLWWNAGQYESACGCAKRIPTQARIFGMLVESFSQRDNHIRKWGLNLENTMADVPMLGDNFNNERYCHEWIFMPSSVFFHLRSTKYAPMGCLYRDKGCVFRSL